MFGRVKVTSVVLFVAIAIVNYDNHVCLDMKKRSKNSWFVVYFTLIFNW